MAVASSLFKQANCTRYFWFQGIFSHQKREAQFLILSLCSVSLMNAINSEACICDLPYEIWLQIFKLISPEDVLTLRAVCRKLYQLGSSESLWKILLEADMESWPIVSHSHNPLIGSSRHAMDVYRICRPRRSELQLPLSTVRSSSLFAQFFGGLKSIMGSWAQAEVPRVAVFGPGIESPRTSLIVHQLLGLSTEHNGSNTMQLIEFVRPPPGAEGHGGGLVELLPTGQRFHMVVLYTEFKELRERESDTRDRVVRSPFFTDQLNGEKTANVKTRELFASLSGMIYVVDSTCPSGQVPPSSEKEVQFLCQCAPPVAPLLVLAAFGDETGDGRSAVRVSPAACVKQLDLNSMVRPWQVCAVKVVKGSEQLTVPVNWLGISAAHAK